MAPPSPDISTLFLVSDPGIVERTIATLISNAIKFTNQGAVQPFVWPLENMDTKDIDEPRLVKAFSNNDISSVTQDSYSCTSSETSSKLNIDNQRIKYVAVGVADTGIGLDKAKLELAKSFISTSTSRSRKHGAQNTGFGLYHAHLQARALNTKLQLSSIDDCRHLLSPSFLKTIKDTTFSEKGNKGTVLYFILPVFEDGENADRAMTEQISAAKIEELSHANKSEYIFRPLPSPNSIDGHFKILVADDVPMLRKGMIHALEQLWCNNFPYCPLSLSTGCSAEDVLRAVESEAFDMIICDHNFVMDKSKVKVTAPGSDGKERPKIRNGPKVLCISQVLSATKQ